MFLTIPIVGHVIILGYLAATSVSGLEGAVTVGGLSALGAALYSIGIPKDSVVHYEADLKADSFLVMAHGSAAEMTRAKEILGNANPVRMDAHSGAQTSAAAGALVHSAD